MQVRFKEQDTGACNLTNVISFQNKKNVTIFIMNTTTTESFQQCFQERINTIVVHRFYRGISGDATITTVVEDLSKFIWNKIY